METIWKYVDTQGVRHLTTSIDEASVALQVYGRVFGEMIRDG
jgi:hypothetical protein